MDITPIIISVIGLAGAGIAVLIVYLRTKLPAAKLEQLSRWVGIFVSAAEQIFTGSGRGPEKLDYVVKALAAKGITVDLDNISDATRAMIEAAVLQLK